MSNRCKVIKIFNKKCKICNTKIPRANVKYCSMKCKITGIIKPLLQCNCERCGKCFYKKPSDKKRFCTKLCSIYATAEKVKGKPKIKKNIQITSGKGRAEVYETFY